MYGPILHLISLKQEGQVVYIIISPRAPAGHHANTAMDGAHSIPIN
jgi:hypothetical protein